MKEEEIKLLLSAIAQLSCDVNDLKQVVLDKPARERLDSNIWLNLDGLCMYHPDKPSKATVYGWVSSGLIPVHKTGKRLRFHKTEIDGWLELGKKRTTSEICRDASNYVGKRKGGK